MMQHLQKQLKYNKYECPICYNKIYRNQKTWHCCDCCFSIFHYKCMKEWTLNKDQWQCPKCNHLYNNLNLSCWCGKEQVQRCNAICDKSLSCSHNCPLKCHPGPCPPCLYTNTTPMYCYCNKKHKFNLKCSDNKEFSCNQPCGNTLNCGKHKCSKLCHPGACDLCELKEIVYCCCLSFKSEMVCDSSIFSISEFDAFTMKRCKVIEHNGSINIGFTHTENSIKTSHRIQPNCSFLFNCKIHRCSDSYGNECHISIDHPSACPLDPSIYTTCPCRSTKLDRKSCSDAIICCSNQCNKQLDCQHLCKMTCHFGPCNPCNELVTQYCHCKLQQRQEKCGSLKTFSCDFVCTESMDCKVHKCNKQCCPASSNSIKEQFRLLKDMKIKFKKGLPIIAELVDPFIQFKSILDKKHECKAICNRKLKCGLHVCKYPCHSGSCPTCLEELVINDTTLLSCFCGSSTVELPVYCGTTLPPTCTNDCNRPHYCKHPKIKHECHSVDVKCTPCTYLDSTPCHCGSQLINNIPCHQITSKHLPSCNKICGNLQPCGVHFCREICHVHDPTVVCTQICNKSRACTHNCNAPCHSITDCKPCDLQVEIRAKVGISCNHNTSMTVKCDHLFSMLTLLNIEIKQSDDGTSWRKSLPYFIIPNPKCCELYDKLQEFGYSTSQISRRDGLITLEYLTDHYLTEDVMVYATAEFVDEQIKELLKFKYERVPVVYRYKPMTRLKRKLIHFIAESMDLYSYSIDKEPNRSICVERQAPNYIIDLVDDTHSRGHSASESQ
eukprot:NODE_964_length_2722_cov_0.198246.p1 type:complete len:778 gc:universal NODE_964_length_2722_cov_0.198246:221-2554(+)